MAITENNSIASAWKPSEEGRYFSDFLHYTKTGLKTISPVLAIMIAYIVAVYLYLSYFGRTSDINIDIYFQKLLPQLVIFLPLIFLFAGVLSAVRRGKHRRFLALKQLFKSRYVANFVVGALTLTLLLVFMGMYTAIKNSFGDMMGFRHDEWQADLDKILFFGHDPWRVLFTPFHSIGWQKIIEINYNVFWHVQSFVIIAIAAYSDFRSETKVRYLICVGLVWAIIGTVFAGMFISAGPAFYGFVTGDNLRFGEQLELLAQYEASTAVKFQAYLWDAYESASASFATGISAFPSIHVSVVSLNVFFAFEINRKVGFLALAYALFVGYSSVYLAWHYAVDGIAAAILVAAIYYAVRSIWSRKPARA